MLYLIELLGLPFLACVAMGAILGYLGIHVLSREIVFVDIALAQTAAFGVAVIDADFEAMATGLHSASVERFCLGASLQRAGARLCDLAVFR